jgi:hypothetical protein
MNRQKTLLTEIATDAKAINIARSQPIPEAEVDRSLGFLRAIVLDLPLQTGGQIDTESKQIVETATEAGSTLKDIQKLAGIK